MSGLLGRLIGRAAPPAVHPAPPIKDEAPQPESKPSIWRAVFDADGTTSVRTRLGADGWVEMVVAVQDSWTKVHLCGGHVQDLFPEEIEAQQRRAIAITLKTIMGAEDADAVLVSAWDDFARALQMLHDSGPNASAKRDARAWELLGKADELICMTPATTLRGAAVKLRRSLQIIETDGFMDKALRERDDDAIFARSSELDYEARLVADALQAITEIKARS